MESPDFWNDADKAHQHLESPSKHRNGESLDPVLEDGIMPKQKSIA